MKKLILIVVNVVCLIQLHAQSYIDDKGKTHLWGQIEVEDLKTGNQKDWFEKNSIEYSSKLTPEDGKPFRGVTAKIFLGTWCGDTKFLVPKFIKTWTDLGYSESDLELIALHNKDGDYKQGPNDETLGFNIHRVPTMIMYKDDRELGRIVERTVFDLDTDIMQILNGNPYKERYQGVTILNRLMQEIDVDSLFNRTNINSIFQTIRREVSSSGELNTFGYVLKSQNQLDKAEFVFLLNRYLFPYDPNIRDSYGEILFEQREFEKAKEQYLEVLRLKGEDENATKQLHKIYDVLASIKQENE